MEMSMGLSFLVVCAEWSFLSELHAAKLKTINKQMISLISEKFIYNIFYSEQTIPVTSQQLLH